MHDWEQDVRRGHITLVVASVLDGLALREHTYTFAALIPAMQQYFWRNSLPSLCGIVAEHAKLARSYAKQSALLKEDNIINDLADTIELVATTTLREQAKAERFLVAYSGSK
jgi:hypothetical protein